MYTEQTLQCCDCNADFIFTPEEQEFFSSKGFQPPRRCKECRNAKKQRNQGFGGGGGGSRGPRQMFDVVCAACGCETQVPFKPDGRKPVYCRGCMA